MLRFFATRLGWLLVTVLVVTFLVFCVNEFSPGQVARKILGPFATQEQVAILTEQMGLNRPVFIRYFDWLWHTAAAAISAIRPSTRPRSTTSSGTGSATPASWPPSPSRSSCRFPILFGISRRHARGLAARPLASRSPASSRPRSRNSPRACSWWRSSSIWLGLLPGTSPLESRRIGRLPRSSSCRCW